MDHNSKERSRASAWDSEQAAIHGFSNAAKATLEAMMKAVLRR